MSEQRIDPAASAFGSAAADYEAARPSYPREAIDALREHAGVAPGRRVCDLAAGTGKLTRLLVEAGADVIAVEPVQGMREELKAAVPSVDVRDGVAEDIPLDDGAVDLVTVGQAFHWFRVDEALREIQRVLAPGGFVAILFNERDERTSWVKTWNDAIEWHSRRIAHYQDTDWTVLLTNGGFHDVGYHRVEWRQPMTRELVASRVRSVSYVAELDEAGQQEYVDRVLSLVAGFDEPFDLPYITHLWTASRS
jgi:ubiquinone/menaquinone biosynthesis C-methylase UbiE